MQEKYRDKYRALGLRIAMYRKMRGYTQEQFAEKIGKSWSFISQIEANNGSKLKGVSLDTLFSDVYKRQSLTFIDSFGFQSPRNLSITFSTHLSDNFDTSQLSSDIFAIAIPAYINAPSASSS